MQAIQSSAGNNATRAASAPNGRDLSATVTRPLESASTSALARTATTSVARRSSSTASLGRTSSAASAHLTQLELDKQRRLSAQAHGHTAQSHRYAHTSALSSPSSTASYSSNLFGTSSSSSQQQPPPASQFTVMSMNELVHVAQLAHGADSADQAARQRELKEKSMARYKNWNNTLEAQREKKKAEKLEELRVREREQQMIDAEEARYREAQRRVVIDRANKLLYQEKDAVKTLHSGMMLSSIIKERETQIMIKQRKVQEQAKQEAEFMAFAEVERQKALDRERAEQQKRSTEQRELAKQQRLQLEAYRRKQSKMREEEVKEGEVNKQIALQGMQEEAEDEANKLTKQREMNLVYIQMNEEERKMKDVLRRMEENETRKIEQYAIEKERVIEQRKQDEQRKKAAKAARAEKIMKTMGDQLMAIRERETKRIERQVEQAIEKKEQEFEEQRRRREELKDAMVKARERQIQRKQAERELQRQQEQVMLQEWNMKNAELTQLEREEKARERAINKMVAGMQRTQMRENEAQCRHEVELERQEVQVREAAERHEDEVFQQYAEEQMRRMAARGRNVVPMKLALAKEQLRQTRFCT